VCRPEPSVRRRIHVCHELCFATLFHRLCDDAAELKTRVPLSLFFLGGEDLHVGYVTRNPKFGLTRPVLEIACETTDFDGIRH
jgi:hypothetical protein